MNFKSLIVSALAVAAFGLSACGDDSSKSTAVNYTPDIPNDTGMVIPDIPTTAVSPIRIENFNIAGNTGSMIRFGGSIKLEYSDTTAVTNMDALSLDSVGFVIGQIRNGVPYTIATKPVVTTPFVKTPNNIANINQMGVTLNLLETSFTECGDFQMYVVAYASQLEANGSSTQFVSKDSIAFQRPNETYCQTTANSSSSSAEPVAQPIMDSCTIQLATNGLRGVDLETCTAYAATDFAANAAAIDIVMTVGGGSVTISGAKASGDASLAAGNDLTFGMMTNSAYDVPPLIPQPPVYASVFKHSQITSPTIDDVQDLVGSYYVAKNAAIYNETTKAGFYSILVVKAVKAESNYNITLMVWRVTAP